MILWYAASCHLGNGHVGPGFQPDHAEQGSAMLLASEHAHSALYLYTLVYSVLP